MADGADGEREGAAEEEEALRSVCAWRAHLASRPPEPARP